MLVEGIFRKIISYKDTWRKPFNKMNAISFSLTAVVVVSEEKNKK
jgi:hypothetical protein